MTWGNFSRFKEIYAPTDISRVIEMAIDKNDIIKNNKKIVYYNIPCSLDIETSSFFRSTGNGEEMEKVAIMYEWTLGLNGAVIIGRTWTELLQTYQVLTTQLSLGENLRLILYIQNLGYEFQFIRKWFEWERIFSLDVRKPCSALTTEGVEMRCSYLLSGYNLKKMGEHLHKYKVLKMDGDLDYSLIRHSKTPLKNKELKYCENDVRVVMSYIQECIEESGNITRIPLTKTGYVRNYCRNSCMYEGSHKKNVRKYLNYRELMQSMTIDIDEYQQLKRAFQGGFTHANAMYSDKVLHDVGSFDLVSSYPYAMLSEKFPMGKGKIIKLENKEQFEKYMKKYCCLFDIEFVNLQSQTFIEHPLSSSRCYRKDTVVEDNGRVVSAKKILTTITEQDFMIFKTFYKWDKMRIYNFRVYKKTYLPTDFVKSILKLYGDKTKLKGVKGKELEYLKSKEMVNSCYGMTVTDICRDDITYIDTKWDKDKPDLESSLERYNNSKRRFLFYPWGVWITAYARTNLFTGIYSFGTDYVYSDTDSVKAKNVENHMDYINKFNDIVKKKLAQASIYHKIPLSEFEPKTIQGNKKLLGIWESEGIYTRFKTLGAKRYMVEQDGEINITVSGLNKKIAVPYLLNKFGKDIFNSFTNELYIPSGFTGKNTHTYIDEERKGTVVDYLGIEHSYQEKSAIHLEPTDYTLSLSDNYIDYLKGIRNYVK
jgi:hypothetical protein